MAALVTMTSSAIGPFSVSIWSAKSWDNFWTRSRTKRCGCPAGCCWLGLSETIWCLLRCQKSQTMPNHTNSRSKNSCNLWRKCKTRNCKERWPKDDTSGKCPAGTWHPGKNIMRDTALILHLQVHPFHQSRDLESVVHTSFMFVKLASNLSRWLKLNAIRKLMATYINLSTQSYSAER